MISSIAPAILDRRLLRRADRDAQLSLAGWWKVVRRVVQRGHRDADVIKRPRVFCQNSGGCGSTYLIRLLEANRIPGVFHERDPDLNRIGLQHYHWPLSTDRLKTLLRYTRHDVYLEANNRLFSLSRELAAAFPNADFIHLHRDGTEAVRSALSKPAVSRYLATNPRFAGQLAGPSRATPFVRFCHYWANVNRRIERDLQQVQSETGRRVVRLKFEDLIAGRSLEPLEDLLGRPLRQRTRGVVNAGRVGSRGRFPAYSDWTKSQRAQFESICGPVMASLGR